MSKYDGMTIQELEDELRGLWIDAVSGGLRFRGRPSERYINRHAQKIRKLDAVLSKKIAEAKEKIYD